MGGSFPSRLIDLSGNAQVQEASRYFAGMSRRGEWGVLSPVQPIERAVDLLCQLLIVQCQGGLARPQGSDLVLTERNAVAAIGRGCALNAGAHLLVAAAED